MSRRPLELVLGRLRAVGSEPKRTGGGWMAPCPAHEDSTPSLSVAEGDDGRVLVHDHGGCDTRDVLAALGLTFRDLFEGGRG